MNNFSKTFFLTFLIASMFFIACSEDDSNNDNDLVITPTLNGTILDSTFTFASGYAEANSYVSTYGELNQYDSYESSTNRAGYSVYLSSEDNLSCDNTSSPTFGLRLYVPGTEVGIEDSIGIRLYHPSAGYNFIGGPSLSVNITKLNDTLFEGTLTAVDTTNNGSNNTSINGEFSVPICLFD